MSSVTMYVFMGVRDTYRGETKSVSGISYEYDGTLYNFGYACNKDTPPVYGLSLNLKAAVESLDNLELDVKELAIVSSPTSKADGDVDLVYRLFNTESNYDTVIASIAGNKNIAGKPSQKALLTIAELLKELKAKGVEFLTGFKETKASITGSIQADSVASRAYFQHLDGNTDPIVEVILPKETKAKTKAVPKLLTDNILFNWRKDTAITISDDVKGNIYYTGNGELENKTPKGVKLDKIVAKGNVYYTGNNKRLRVLGKLSAEDRYNVVILKEPATYLETVFAHQRELCKGIYSTEQMVAYRNRELFSGGVSNYIEAGDFSRLGYNMSGDLYTTTVPRKDLSYVFNPPRLAFKIKRALENNETKLMHYIGKALDGVGCCATDITTLLYDTTDEAKLKLHPEIDNKLKYLKIPDVTIPTGRTVNIKALMKFDLPERNFFNKLVKDSPKVSLITWMVDDHTVGYACVVETIEGWLFYCSVYGSRHLLRTAAASRRKSK